MLFEDGVIKTPDINFDNTCGGIGKVLLDCCKKFKDRVALINARTNDFDTYQTFLQKSVGAAEALHKRGFGKGDLVALCSNKENINASVPLLAAQFLGCIAFSIDPSLSVEECEELLQQVQPKIIFLIEEAKYLITEVLKRKGYDIELITFGKHFEEEFLGIIDQACFKPFHVQNLQDTGFIHFSSGTTGTPKPICLNHYYFLALHASVGFSCEGQLQEKLHHGHPVGAVSLRYSNWYWISSTIEMVIFCMAGGCRLLRDEFHVNEFWSDVANYQVTDVFVSPLHCVDLCESQIPVNSDVTSLKKIFSGGQVLHRDYTCELRKLLPNVFIAQVYGLTECGEATAFDSNLPEHRHLLASKPDSCGLPVKGLFYKVVDVDTGKLCGPNQHGELYLKGKKLFTSFYNRDCSESFDEEGYFRTGDLVYFDEDFCFFVVDRIKSILGYKNWLIYPYHIEKVLLGHPAVHNALVIGLPHKVDGEQLMGVVVLKKNLNQDVSEEELVRYVDQRVEDHKRLRGGVKIIESMPNTATGKVNRLKLKQIVLNNLTIRDL